MFTKKLCTTASATLGAFALLAVSVVPGTAQAYFPSVFIIPEDNARQPTVRVVPRRRQSSVNPVFRSQRGRSVITSPTRGNNTYLNPASRVTQNHRSRLKEVFDRLAVENEERYNDNESLYDAQLDLRSLVTHECFEVRRAEEQRCKFLFGPYFNLRESLLDNSLRTILVTNNPDVSPEMRALLSKVTDQVRQQHPSTDTDDRETSARWMEQRAHTLWSVCRKKFGAQGMHGCYQRNQRLLRSRMLPMTERNVY